MTLMNLLLIETFQSTKVNFQSCISIDTFFVNEF